MFVVAQIISGVALVINTSGRLFKKQSVNLLFNLVANVLIAISLFFLHAYAGMAITILCVVRNAILFIYAKYNLANDKKTLICFSLLFIACGFIGYTNFFEYIIVVLKGLTYTYGAWQKNKYIFRVYSITSNIFTIQYNLLYNGYINILNEVICAIFTVFVIIKEQRRERRLESGTTSSISDN